jgi:hypothetical protein
MLHVAIGESIDPVLDRPDHHPFGDIDLRRRSRGLVQPLHGIVDPDVDLA